jgi:hypothetical protein
MQYCNHCGSQAPLGSHFCGSCGHLLGDETKDAAGLTRPSQPNLPTQSTPSPLNNPFPFPLDYVQPRHSDVRTTSENKWPELNQGNQQNQKLQQLQQSNQRYTNENRAIFPDQALPFTPLYHQFPVTNVPAVQGTPQIGNVPAVQGTPQIGNVPSVHGTPQIGGAPSVQGAPSAGRPPVSPANPHPPGGAVPHAAPSLHQHTWAGQQAQHHVPQHSPPAGQLEHQGHQGGQHPGGPQQAIKAQHAHRIGLPHLPKAGATTTKIAMGAATKWGIVAVTAVVVLATSSVIFVFANAAGLSLSGGSSVSVGGTLHIHGKGFVPNGSVALTLDNGLPVTATGSLVQKVVDTEAASRAADASQLLASTGRTGNLAPSNNAVTVGITGNFDTDVTVPSTWSLGPHVIHAMEGLGSRSATLSFTVQASPAHLIVTPSTLNVGTISMGSKAIEAILVGNTGGSQLTWNATTDGSSWLKLTNSVGAIEPHGAQVPLYVTIDATSLQTGDYSAAITIHSQNGGDAQVPIHMHIDPAPQVQQAQLSINPTTIDFGTVTAEQQVFDNLTVGNQGTLALNWQADTGGASWLTLSPTSGNVAVGGLPQTVQVIADTSNSSLQQGLNSATITIKWNGGTTTIPVTLTLNPSTASPSPPILAVTPSGFSVPGDSNCTYDATAGWSCTAALSSLVTAQSNLDWTSASSGISNVSFSPSSGTLTPGQNTSVTISIPNTACPANATFTFSGPANNVALAWSCAALTLTADKTSLNANTDCTFNNGWSCNVTLGTGANDQGTLSWSASSSTSGVTFSPPSGTLVSGQTAQVSISVPNTTCPANATFTFSQTGGNSVPVSWSCSPPGGTVEPTSLDQNSSSCTANSDGTYGCTVTVSETPAGTLSWSASSDVGGSINPQSGQLTPGQSSQTVTIASIPCQNGTFTFTFTGSNTVQVSWSCTPPTITVTLSGTCPGDGQGNSVCTDTLQETGGPGTVSWNATAESDLPGTNLPQSGSLSTGQSVQVRVVIPNSDCPSGGGTAGHYDYSWPTGNNFRVTFTCPASSSPQAVLSSSFVPPFAALASIAGFAGIDRRVRGGKYKI